MRHFKRKKRLIWWFLSLKLLKVETLDTIGQQRVFVWTGSNMNKLNFLIKISKSLKPLDLDNNLEVLFFEDELLIKLSQAKVETEYK